MKHITDKEYCDLGMKTALQWLKQGFVPYLNTGIELWCNPYHNRSAVYYTREEVYRASADELHLLLKPIREKRKHNAEIYRQRKIADYTDSLAREYERGRADAAVEYSALIAKLHRSFKDVIFSLTNTEDIIPYVNPSGKIVFDVETTGLNSEIDEILQISMLDGGGKILYSSYVKPYYMQSWEVAQRVNNITWEMITDAPYPHEIIPVIKGMFESATEWISYNGSFDLGFLKWWGIEPKEYTVLSDVMFSFAQLYGEWDAKYCDYKWQSLKTCAEYFCYDFKAHDSLEDVKATLHCYNCLEKMYTTDSCRDYNI